MMRSKRKRARIPLISIARLTPEGMELKEYVLIRDISTDGLGIYSKQRYRKGDLVLVELTLTIQEEKIIESVSGKVVWVAPLPDQNHFAVGIQFEKMQLEKPKLYAHIKKLEERYGEGPF
ncbi:MAG: PilZ domain-containing protein [Candidatus Manganitrophus sp.]|nr:MAG: PilZ domain-containing protein [Candidatus Manganitrophus sp.]